MADFVEQAPGPAGQRLELTRQARVRVELGRGRIAHERDSSEPALTTVLGSGCSSGTVLTSIRLDFPAFTPRLLGELDRARTWGRTLAGHLIR